MFINFSTFSQLTVDNSQTPEQLVQNILAGPGVVISNVTFNGAAGNIISTQCGSFNGQNSNVGINSGVILTTGDIQIAEGPNDLGGAGNSLFEPGDDIDLNAIATQDLNDQAVLEFDFIPVGDSISFKYVFSSEEYNEYVCSDFNDVFGFFISGPGINGTFSNNGENIALIPGTNTAVAINTVNIGVSGSNGDPVNCDNIDPNWPAYSIFFNDNTLQTVQYDGMTVVLTAAAAVQCGQTYHIKMAIADAFDGAFDSGVFLQAGSLSSVGLEIDLSTVTGDTIIYENCTSAQFIFTRPQSLIADSAVINYVLSGTALEGIDFTSMIDSIVFVPGEDTVIISLNALQDGILEGNETVIITATLISECGDTIIKTKSLTISEDPIFDATVNAPEVFCPNDSVYMTVAAQGGTPPYIYTWENGEIGDSVPGAINGVGIQTYTVNIVDLCGFTFQDSVTITQSPPPAINLTVNDETATCIEDSVQMFAFPTGGAQPLTTTWSNGATGNTVFGLSAGNPTYIVTVTDACNNFITDNVSITVDIPTPLTITVTAPAATCIQLAVPMTATPSGGFGTITYIWNNGGSTSVVNGVTAGNPTYTVVATDLCGQTVNGTVTIQSAPDPILSIVAPDVTIVCPSNSVSLNAAASNGFMPYSYAWTNTSSTGPQITVSALTNGSQNFDVTATDICGNTITETITLTLNQLLNIDNMGQVSSVFCAPTGVANASVTGSIGTTTFTWNGPGANGPIINNTLSATNLTSGWYYFTVQDAVCQDADSIFVEVLDEVVANFAVSSIVGTLPQTVIFTNSSLNATSFDWNFGNGNSNNSVDISDQSSIYTIAGKYTIELIAFQGICSDTATAVIDVIADPTIHLPNIFTPNGDLDNEGFTLDPQYFKTFTFVILNRWGNIMFEGDLVNHLWNGMTTNNDPASPGTYFYTYTGEALNGEIISGEGLFQLVR